MSFSFAGGRFHSQAVVFVWGWLFLFAGGRFCSWAVVFVRRGPFSFVGDPLHLRAVVFVHGRSSSFAGTRLRSRALIFVWGAIMVERRSWVVVHVGCRDVVGVVGLLLWCDVALPHCCSGLHWWLGGRVIVARGVIGGPCDAAEVGGRRGWWWMRSNVFVC
jgi:hypothetical protein